MNDSEVKFLKEAMKDKAVYQILSEMVEIMEREVAREKEDEIEEIEETTDEEYARWATMDEEGY